VKKQSFRLIVSGVSEITPELSDALYEACEGDIEFNLIDGVATVEFERAASTLEEAIRSAVKQLEGCGMGIRVIRVESRQSNTIAKINADLLGVA
jgi:hypothetical protein